MNRCGHYLQRKGASIVACVCMSLVHSACVLSDRTQSKKPFELVPHEVLVMHPSVNPSEPVERTLFQTWDEQGNIVSYYLDVPSVICGDGQCEIITVRLAWDALGKYIRYELPDGEELTKQGHERFTAADYKKLHVILSDTDSLLKSVNPKDVVSPVDALNDADVDGVSSATVLSDKTAIISGAVYTCYTLWHWANNDVQEAIRNLSKNEMRNAQLSQYLNSGTEEQIVFAMEQLAARHIHDEATVEAVFQQINKGSRERTGQGLAYFESVNTEAYYGVIESLFSQGSSKKRVLYLTSLSSTERQAPAGFYDRFSAHLSELESYYEVHLLLGLLTFHNPSSPEIIGNTLPLLDDQSFLIARKAYYFLRDQELAPAQIEILDIFQQKNADRL